MNREILFRGKRVDNGEWVVGDLIHRQILSRLYIQRQYLFNDSDFECEVRHRQTIKGV